MALTPSSRPTREWPLLLLTLVVVVSICYPLYTWLAPETTVSFSKWNAERWGRLLIGPEQIACYCCFVWACFILMSRSLEIRRQRRAFGLNLLPTDDSVRILQEDARPLQRQIDEVTGRKGPFILANMIRSALAKFALSRNSQQVSETIRTQAEVEQGRLVTGLSMVHYLAWAIPALGFLGTVRGLAGSMATAGLTEADTADFINQATKHLAVAFDCTLIALSLSLVIMFLLNAAQRSEEKLVIDCQQYCLEHLVNRIYEPESADSATLALTARGDMGSIPGGRSERIAQ